MPFSLLTERLWAAQPDALLPILAAFRRAMPSAVSSPGKEGGPETAFPNPGGHVPLPAGAHWAGPGAQVGALAGAAFGSDADRPYTVQDGVAVIPVRGLLTPRATWAWGYGYTTGMLDQLRPAIEYALADKGVAAILLDVDSPGGSVTGMKELADFIASARNAKPMAAYANGTMASAAYMVGSATGRVLAPATANVGSIGIISVYEDWSKWNDKAGISYAYMTSGRWKAVGNPDTPLAEDERAYLQARLDSLYQHFTDGVSASMGLDTASLDVWADGKVFVASDAPKGLVTDIVADIETAIATLAKETTMDRQTLAAQHPELLASIEREAADKARAEATESTTNATTARQQACIAAVKAVAGNDAATRVQALLEQNLTAQQIEAVAGMMSPAAAQPAATTPQAEAPATPERILGAIQQAHAAPLGGAPATPGAETPAQFGLRMANMLK